MSKVLKTPKGTRDLGPNDVRMRDYIFGVIKKYFELYDGQPMDTPVLERLNTVTNLYGDEFDKLVYKLDDQGGEKLLLRYDLTIPFARYITSNAIDTFKRYQIGKVYRRDEPQMSRGRFREFYQADFDIVGGETSSRIQDTEMLLLLVDILKELIGEGTFSVMVNDKGVLYDALKSVGIDEGDYNKVCSSLDKLDKLPLVNVVDEIIHKGIEGGIVNKLTVFITMVQSFEDSEMSVLERLRILLERGFITETTISIMKKLFENINLLGLSDYVIFNPLLSRGLDYYTGIIYEAVLLDRTVISSSIAAGGRYNSMMKKLGHRDTSAIGLSLGIERIVTILEKRQMVVKDDISLVYVATIGKDLEVSKMVLVDEIRKAGIKVSFSYKSNAKMRNHLDYVFEKEIKYMIILGETELSSGTLKVKNIDERKEEIIRRESLVDFLRGLKK